jgi:hypothetical protein
MGNYEFSILFFDEQNEQTLITWGEILFNILLRMGLKSGTATLYKLNHDGLVDFCYGVTNSLIKADFYKKIMFPIACESGIEYIYSIINDDKYMIKNFINSIYLESFWDNEFKTYIANLVRIEIYARSPVEIKRNKEHILNLWDTYKSKVGIDDLFFDDDIPIKEQIKLMQT